MKHKKIIYVLALMVISIVIAHQLTTRHANAATFTVTTTADNGNNAAPTAGSLRKAIIDANASVGLDTIQFNRRHNFDGTQHHLRQ